MPMRLEGSCRCGAISFSVDSHTPYPYQRRYCSIYRKSAGGGGYAINIMGLANTLKVKGKSVLGVSGESIANLTFGRSGRARVRVNVQLIDAENGAHLWADRFDTDRVNLAEAQDEITSRWREMDSNPRSPVARRVRSSGGDRRHRISQDQ
jgi:hypothetical protein